MRNVVYVKYDEDKRMIKVRYDDGEEDWFSYKNYYFVEDERGRYKTIDGKRAEKVRMGKLDNRWSLKDREGIYECDVRIEDRFMIDMYDEMRFAEKFRWAVIDLEVDDSNGSPSLEEEVYCCSIVYDDGSEDWVYNDEHNNHSFFRKVVGILKDKGVDVLWAWNGNNFDYNYFKYYVEDFEVEYLDAMQWYKKLVGASKLALDYVAKEEGFGGKLFVHHKVSELSKEDLKKYNMEDSRLVYKILKKYGISDVVGTLANLSGVRYTHVSSYMWVLDNILIREAHKKGYVLPCMKDVKDDGYEGAFVLEPDIQVKEWVGVFDFASLYPNIILANNIDVIEEGLMVDMVRDFLKLRKKYKDMWKETNDRKYYYWQWAYKILVNALYGVIGNTHFRLYDKRIVSEITRKGREAILGMLNLVEEAGYKVLYGDTDSLFVEVGIDKESEYRFIEKLINKKMYPLRVKWEKTYRRIIFTGKKKRYAGLLYYKDGKKVEGKEYDIKGLEVVRGDWCDLAKEVQMKVIEMALEGKSEKELNEYVQGVKKDMYAGKYDEKLVITKSVKKLEDYKVEQPHVRALREYIERSGDVNPLWVSFIYVRGGDVRAVIDKEDLKDIDYKWYWEKQIKVVGDRIIDVLKYMKQRTLFEGW